jgi:UPF0271 protein
VFDLYVEGVLLTMKFLLDTSALLSGKEFVINDEFELLTVPSVEAELIRGPSNTDDDWTDIQLKFEFLIDAGLKIVQPSDRSIEIIKSAAERTGDIKRLSDTDIELLALGFELGTDFHDVVLLTDDYSIQNICTELDINYQSVMEKGITKKYHWQYRCIGCGKIWDDPLEVCPICGSKVRTKANKMDKI